MPTDSDNAVQVAATLINEIYSSSGLNAEIRQCEVITNITRYVYSPANPDEINQILYPYCVVLSQECDLLWDYRAVAAGNAGAMSGILLYEAEPASEARSRIKGSDLWRKIVGNNDERYHALSPVGTTCDLEGSGIPSLIVDFKRYFTIPPAQLYEQLGAAARRRTRLCTPYLEHLQSRAGTYFSRVGIPEPHKVVLD